MSTRDEWSQDPCLMTMLPAAPAMSKLAGVMHPDAPNEVVRSAEIQAVVPIEVLEAGLNAKANVAPRC